jgi:hypothetical protein
MTTPRRRSRQHERQPGGHGEQPTERLRPPSGRQPYGSRRPSAQQQRYGEHSDAPTERWRRNISDRTAIVTGIVAVAALLAVGAGVWLISDHGNGNGASGANTSPSTSAPGSASRSVKAPGAPPPGAAVDAAVGDCIKVDAASATDARVEPARCGDPRAVYRVGVREEGGRHECPGADYVSYREEGGLLLCLTLNAEEGDCFKETRQQDARVPCGSPVASYRVDRVVEGVDDASRCGESNASNALTYPKPPLTICREAVE